MYVIRTCTHTKSLEMCLVACFIFSFSFLLSSRRKCYIVIDSKSNFACSFRLVDENWQIKIAVVFTALHGMQTRSHDENSVRPSVCLSNACIVTKRKKNLCRFLHHTKRFIKYLGFFQLYDRATCVDKESAGVFRRRMERLLHLSYVRTCDAVILDQALFR